MHTIWNVIHLVACKLWQTLHSGKQTWPHNHNAPFWALCGKIGRQMFFPSPFLL